VPTTEREAAAILLWGEDSFLLRDAALDVLGSVQPTEVDASEWRGGETADLATPSLFGDRRALLVTGSRALSPEALSELASYLASPAPHAMLVLTVQVPERAKPPVALTKLMEGAGELRQVALARKDLPSWLLARAGRRSMAVAPDGARRLIEILGESPAALDAALDQLAAAFHGERITRAHVESQFTGLGEQRVWDLCDRAFGRDLPGSIRSLRALLDGRDDPLIILGGVASRLRDMIRVKALPDRIPLGEVAKRAGLRFEWQARRYRDHARRFSMEELVRIHERVVAADRDIKSGAPGEVVMPVVIAAVSGPPG
jgi:DNA polymerase III subunit delta